MTTNPPPIPGLRARNYVFDPRPAYPLLITVSRYTPLAPPTAHGTPLTLVFTHGTGFHKEQWVPAITDLLQFAAGTISIGDIFIIDAPNHGDAALLNARTLHEDGYTQVFSWEEYGRAIHLVLANRGVWRELGAGGVRDLSDAAPDLSDPARTLVGIGHSMGAVGLILSTSHTARPQANLRALVLAEPMIIPPADALRDAAAAKAKATGTAVDTPKKEGMTDGKGGVSDALLTGALARRDIWPSHEAAFEALSARKAFKVWDPRVLRAFCDYGLHALPTRDYPDKTPADGVTLKCSKFQEAATYRDSAGRIHAFRLLHFLVRALPVHVIYGAIDDYVPRSAKDIVTGVATGGVENLKSLTRVAGSGHLIVQCAPRGLAEKIRDALVLITNSPSAANVALESKL
ncbi:hypothetical protein PLICRDRAFT_38279 [Plicaturopsis crispa FD-325 SS-3]|nr:hypothetical protein PLICRDRAFT_38279 [Plicaturopsis crispa FD-325 SS-3]